MGTPTTIAFSPSVKAIQRDRGSRRAYERLDDRGFPSEVTGELADLLASIDTAFIASVNAAGQPYIQHRGGPKGFLRVLDDRTIGFADRIGNRQYITTGNLTDNPRVCVIAIDFVERTRVKIWGRARVLPLTDPLANRLAVAGKLEQLIVIEVTAWDVNCPQHIAIKLDATDVERIVSPMRERIAELEAKLRERP